MVILHRLIPPLYDYFAKLGKSETSHRFFRRYFVHKHHGEIGAELLSKISETPDVVEEVRSHTSEDTEKDFYMRLLDEVDSTY